MADLSPGPNAVQYAKQPDGRDSANGGYEAERKRQEEHNQRLISNDGTENPFQMWRELGDMMTKNVTVIRYNKNLQETDAKLVGVAGALPQREPERQERSGPIRQFVFTRQLYNMLQTGARDRAGSGGCAMSRGARTTSRTSRSATTRSS